MSDISVRLRYSDSGTESMLLFFTRAIDVAYVGVVPYMLGLTYGLPLRIAGVAASGARSHGVVMKGSPPVDGPLRIATVSGSSGHFTAWCWLQRHEQSAVFIDLPPHQQVRALREGYVHAVGTWEPHLSTAIASGGELVFSGTEMEFPLMELLVTVADTPVAATVASLVRLHREYCEELVNRPSQDDMDFLRRLFRVTWSEAQVRELLRTTFDLVEDGRQDFTLLRRTCQRVAQFIGSTALGVARGSALAVIDKVEYLPEAGADSFSNERQVRVGYSDDLMCIPLLIARNGPAPDGFRFEGQPRREEERIAALPDSMRETVEQARELMLMDPALATMKMARLAELTLRSLSEQLLGKQSARQISAVIAELEEAGLVPPIIATSAHWIRSVRNVAAHHDEVEQGTAEAALGHLLGLLEWVNESGIAEQRRCPRCAKAVQPDWIVCPNCTWRFEQTCERCGLTLEPSWKACPTCGTSTKES